MVCFKIADFLQSCYSPLREDVKFVCSRYVINLFGLLKILDCLQLVYPFISAVSIKGQGRLIKSMKSILHIK
jgi:hypothetical protein